jgi:hypothetical protein
MLDAIRLDGAAFCLEIGNFAMAEEMLADLGEEASGSSAAQAVQQSIRDAEIAFWGRRCEFASILAARFPNYLAGQLYADLCRSRTQSSVSQRVFSHGT